MFCDIFWIIRLGQCRGAINISMEQRRENTELHTTQYHGLSAGTGENLGEIYQKSHQSWESRAQEPGKVFQKPTGLVIMEICWFDVI